MERRSLCFRDIIIKKIALGVIGAINLGGIGVFLGYMFLHQPIYVDVIAVTPFILGVVGALALLKAPIKEGDVAPWTNAKGALARGITLLTFAPIYLIVNNADWTHYEDAGVAQRIANEIRDQEPKEPSDISSTKGMIFVMTKYGKSGDALFKYGFIQTQETATAWKNLYKELKITLKAREAVVKKKDLDSQMLLAQLDKQLEEHQEKWNQLHKIIASELPNIKRVEIHSPGTWAGWVKDKVRDYTGLFPYDGVLKGKGDVVIA